MSACLLGNDLIRLRHLPQRGRFGAALPFEATEISSFVSLQPRRNRLAFPLGKVSPQRRMRFHFPFALFHIHCASFGLTIAISPLRRSLCVGIFITQRQFARRRFTASLRSAVQSSLLVNE